MTSPGSRPKKSGFLARLQSAAVPVLPVDDGQPIVRPRGVTIASVLAIIAGAIFIFAGIVGYAQTEAALTYAVNQNQIGLNNCTTTFGGYGTTLQTSTVATSLTSSAAVCHSGAQPTQSDLDGFRTTQHVFGVIFAIIGVLFAAAGWFLQQGARWAKRVLVFGGVILLLAAALAKLSTPITLLGTLVLAIAVVMTYIGRNSVFFALVNLRGKQH
jgi:hypothetical protein